MENNPFIACENLVKIYKIANIEVVALQGLDLVVGEGEMLGIVGASGSGKTTLLNILGGLDRPSAGKVVVGGLDLLKASPFDLDNYRRDRVGFVWQQTTRNLIPYLSALDNVAFPMLITGRERLDWARELLAAVGLWEKRGSLPAQLSGGQQQRVAIALAMANKPALLLGDEPTGELDSQTAAEVLLLFHKINERYGTTIILVTHDPRTAAAMNRVVTIRDGRTSVEALRRTVDIDTQPREHIQEAVFEQYLVVDSVGRLQLPEQLVEEAGIQRRVSVARIEKGILLRPADMPVGNAKISTVMEGQPVIRESSWQQSFEGSGTTVQAKDLWRIYEKGAQKVVALRGVNLTVPHGKFVALRGRSGSGKTTLLNCISGLDAPTQGEVFIADRPIHQLSEADRLALRREQIGFVFQSPALLASYTAAENIELRLQLAGFPRDLWQTRVQEALALVGLARWADHYPHELSGGQQQRIGIARALAANPGLILADEPTGELDTATGQAILHLLREISVSQHETVLLATHDPAVDEFVDQVYVLKDGQVETSV